MPSCTKWEVRTATTRLEPLPRPGTGLSRRRRRAGLALTLLGLPLLTGLLVAVGEALPLDSVFLLYLLTVVVVAVVGGVLPAMVAAVGSFLLVNWFLTPPFGTLFVEGTGRVIDLVVFLLVGLTVSVTVDLGARRRVIGARAQLEAHTLAQLSSTPMALTGPDLVLSHVRALFDLDAVHLVQGQDMECSNGGVEHEIGVTLARAGARPDTPAAVTEPAGAGLQLLVWGRELAGDDIRALRGFAHVAGRAEEGRRLVDEAARGRELAEVDRLRTALLAAVGHDLRTPLAAAKAATSALLSKDFPLTPTDQRELLVTVEESIDRLNDLIANLLDLSRLQAGALQPALRPVGVDEVVARALLTHRGVVHVSVRDDLPRVDADPGLFERVVANLVDNAARHTTAGTQIHVTAADTAGAAPPGVSTADADPPVDHGAVVLRVIDHGPGVPEHDWEHLFVPFQRLDDSSTTGLGLGLAIADGFTRAMGGTLTPSETPGGGLTMSVTMPASGRNRST